MTILFDSARTVNLAPRFAVGIRPSELRMPFTQADLDWAAQAFGEIEDNRHLEELAEQARWDDQFTGAFPVGCCQLCGEPSDQLDPIHELCPECLAAAENATIACQNRNAMGQYRVF